MPTRHPKKPAKKPSKTKPSAKIELTKPISLNLRDGLGLLWQRPLTRDEINQQILTKAFEKLNDVAAYYGIDADDPHKWFKVSYQLSKKLGYMNFTTEHIRGRGTPRKIAIGEDQELVAKMDAIKAKLNLKSATIDGPRRGIQDAAKELKKSTEYGHLSVKTIINRYGIAKNTAGRFPGGIFGPLDKPQATPEK
jgi:hypothetical protein